MNFEDDLSKDIASAMAEVSKTESPVTPPAGDGAPPAAKDSVSPSVPDAPTSAGERARDETGKFAKTDEKKPALANDPAVMVQQSAQQAQPAAVAVAVTDAAKPSAIAPPGHWKGHAKVEWGRLPQTVQKEIVEDYSRISNVEGELGRFKAAIGDRAQVLAATYGSVESGLQNLFALSDFATKNAAGFIQWFAQQRGIDLSQFVQGQGQGSQSAAGSDPMQQEFATLRGQLQQQSQLVQQLQQHVQQAQIAPLQAEVQSFQNDPAHPYFNDVRQHMKALIESGSVQGQGRQLLENSYNQAIWAREDIRQRLLEDERKKFADENAAKVAQAKQAASSITGSPAGSKATIDEPDEDLDATIRRAIRRSAA